MDSGLDQHDASELVLKPASARKFVERPRSLPARKSKVELTPCSPTARNGQGRKRAADGGDLTASLLARRREAFCWWDALPKPHSRIMQIGGRNCDQHRLTTTGA